MQLLSAAMATCMRYTVKSPVFVNKIKITQIRRNGDMAVKDFLFGHTSSVETREGYRFRSEK